MQLKITLSGNRIKLPLAASSTLQGFIYNALADDLSFSTRLHEQGYAFRQRNFKLFSFSELRGKYEVVGKEMFFQDKVFFEVRSVDAYMIQLLYTYLMNNKTVFLGENKVNIDTLHIENKMIFSDSLKVKTISPITVYETAQDGHTTYYAPGEERFYEAIVRNANRKWTSYSDKVLDFEFSVTPTENNWSVKRVTHFKDTFIKAWHSEFYLKGNVEFLNFLYNTGLGSKNSQGFGMFEILE